MASKTVKRATDQLVKKQQRRKKRVLADVEGVRSNMLIGYGLVVGLNNTGDSLKNAPFTQQALRTMLAPHFRSAAS